MLGQILFFIVVFVCFLHLLYLIWEDYREIPVRFNRSQEKPLVSIIVPALNEEKNLPKCLKSLLNLKYPNKEIIVVDGGSTDRTYEIAKSFGVKVLTFKKLPEKWIGKSYGCHIGYQAAKGDILLFTDADTVHSPNSLDYTVAKLLGHDVTLLSMIPYQQAEKWYEYLSGYYFFLAWLIRGLKKNIINEQKKDFFAIGQYMLFQREKYEQIGGHLAIHENVVEDLALAKLVKEHHQRLYYVENKKLVYCRMYPDGFKSFYDGFRKSIWTGMEIVPVQKTIMAILWILFGLLTPVFLLKSIMMQNEFSWIPFGFSYLIFVFALYYDWHSNRKDHILVYLFYPIGFLITTIILITSVYDGVLGRPVKWKGISYQSKKTVINQNSIIKTSVNSKNKSDYKLSKELKELKESKELQLEKKYKLTINAPIISPIESPSLRIPNNIENKQRLASLDYLRGIAILLVVGFHSIERALPSDFWDQFLTSAPKWQFYLFGPFLLLMSWRGFFILISATVYIYSFEKRMRTSGSAVSFLKINLLKGVVLFLFGCIINVFLDPYAAVGYFLQTGQWQPENYIIRLKFSDAIQMIGLGLIIYSIIHYFLVKNRGFEKPIRNIFIYSLLIFFIVGFTPEMNKILYSLYGVTRDEIMGMRTESLLQFLEAMALANIVGYAQPLFPYLAVTFLGCIIGIILSQDQWSNKAKLSNLYIMGIIIIIIGLLDWIILTGMEPMQTFMIAPMWFLIVNTGLQTFVMAIILNVLDYPKSLEKRRIRIRKVRYIRRAGILSLTLFAAQFLDLIPRFLLSQITGLDFVNYGNINTIYQGFLLLGVVIAFWIILLQIWEMIKFYGTFDWLMLYITSSLAKKKIDWQDPLKINKNLYEIEKV